MYVQNSSIEDMTEIFRLYEIATQYQLSKHAVPWPQFSTELVLAEIENKQQWKLTEADQIACVWATTFTDEQIWEEKNAQPSIYIHRIATNPDFRGRQLVEKIVDWAKVFGKQMGKRYVRLDTVGVNEGLIKHYTRCGFDYLGLFKLNNTTGLPAHYKNASVSLFEVEIN